MRKPPAKYTPANSVKLNAYAKLLDEYGIGVFRKRMHDDLDEKVDYNRFDAYSAH